MDSIQDRRLITLKTNLKFNGFAMIDSKLPDQLVPKSKQLPTIEEEEIDFLGDEEKLGDFKILKRDGKLIKPQEKGKGVYYHNQLWGVGVGYVDDNPQPTMDRLGVGLMELIDEKLWRVNSRVEARFKELGENDMVKPIFHNMLSKYFEEVRDINGVNMDISILNGCDTRILDADNNMSMYLPDDINIYDAYDAEEMELDTRGFTNQPGYQDELHSLEELLQSQLRETYEDENINWDDGGLNFNFNPEEFDLDDELEIVEGRAPKKRR